MVDLAGKRCLVTAAAQGIGHASAIALAKAGAHVMATDINEDRLETLSRVKGIDTRRLDVLDTDAVNAMAADLGRIDILFNCAGVVHNGTVLDCTDEEIDFALDLNFKAQLRTIRAVLPGMLERGDGTIINMATVASSIKGVPNRFAYSASKAAVIGLTKSVAADFVSRGIRCNAICPGTVDSPSLQQRLEATGDYDAARKAFVARQPMGRIGSPQEVADLVVYLAGATFSTGQTYVIDGGWTG